MANHFFFISLFSFIHHTIQAALMEDSETKVYDRGVVYFRLNFKLLLLIDRLLLWKKYKN